MGLLAAIDAVRTACRSGIIASGLTVNPAQIVRGWPVGTELTKILSQPTVIKPYQVSVYQLPGAKQGEVALATAPRTVQAPAPSTLTAAVSDNVVTFGGAPQAGANVHVFLDEPQADAFYQVTAADTLASIATALAAAINEVNFLGVTAMASGDAVTISGASSIAANVGSPTTMSVALLEAQRIECNLQVCVWANDPLLRVQVRDAIVQNVGTRDIPSLPLGDGSLMMCAYATDKMIDKSQSSYNLYQHNIVFKCSWGENRIVKATQIAAVKSIINQNDDPAVTQYIGGSST